MSVAGFQRVLRPQSISGRRLVVGLLVALIGIFAIPIPYADLHHAVDYTPYEGFSVAGRVTETLVRGRVVQREGQVLVEKGVGQFLKCNAPDFDLM